MTTYEVLPRSIALGGYVVPIDPLVVALDGYLTPVTAPPTDEDFSCPPLLESEDQTTKVRLAALDATLLLRLTVEDFSVVPGLLPQLSVEDQSVAIALSSEDWTGSKPQLTIENLTPYLRLSAEDLITGSAAPALEAEDRSPILSLSFEDWTARSLPVLQIEDLTSNVRLTLEDETITPDSEAIGCEAMR